MDKESEKFLLKITVILVGIFLFGFSVIASLVTKYTAIEVRVASERNVSIEKDLKTYLTEIETLNKRVDKFTDLFDHSHRISTFKKTGVVIYERSQEHRVKDSEKKYK